MNLSTEGLTNIQWREHPGLFLVAENRFLIRNVVASTHACVAVMKSNIITGVQLVVSDRLRWKAAALPAL
jgi:hypothetical protein